MQIRGKVCGTCYEDNQLKMKIQLQMRKVHENKLMELDVSKLYKDILGLKDPDRLVFRHRKRSRDIDANFKTKIYDFFFHS